MKQYYPYKSTDKPEKKYYIITKNGKKIYFGATDYQDFTQHKDEARKEAYIMPACLPGRDASERFYALGNPREALSRVFKIWRETPAIFDHKFDHSHENASCV